MYAMAQTQHTDFLPSGRRKRDMSFYEKINMAFIEIRITKSWTQNLLKYRKKIPQNFKYIKDNILQIPFI